MIRVLWRRYGRVAIVVVFASGRREVAVVVIEFFLQLRYGGRRRGRQIRGLLERKLRVLLLLVMLLV